MAKLIHSEVGKGEEGEGKIDSLCAPCENIIHLFMKGGRIGDWHFTNGKRANG